MSITALLAVYGNPKVNVNGSDLAILAYLAFKAFEKQNNEVGLSINEIADDVHLKYRATWSAIQRLRKAGHIQFAGTTQGAVVRYRVTPGGEDAPARGKSNGSVVDDTSSSADRGSLETSLDVSPATHPPVADDIPPLSLTTHPPVVGDSHKDSKEKGKNSEDERIARARDRAQPHPRAADFDLTSQPTANDEDNPDDELLPLFLDRTDLGVAARAYNAVAERCGLPEAAPLTDGRRRKLKARLKDCGGLDGWNAVLGKLEASGFLQGDNRYGWNANFDFLLQEKSFTRLMEGSYDGGPCGPGRPGGGVESLIAEMAGEARR